MSSPRRRGKAVPKLKKSAVRDAYGHFLRELRNSVLAPYDRSWANDDFRKAHNSMYRACVEAVKRTADALI